MISNCPKNYLKSKLLQGGKEEKHRCPAKIKQTVENRGMKKQ